MAFKWVWEWTNLVPTSSILLLAVSQNKNRIWTRLRLTRPNVTSFSLSQFDPGCGKPCSRCGRGGRKCCWRIRRRKFRPQKTQSLRRLPTLQDHGNFTHNIITNSRKTELRIAMITMGLSAVPQLLNSSPLWSLPGKLWRLYRLSDSGHQQTEVWKAQVSEYDIQ